jgi:hypothetical protein
MAKVVREIQVETGGYRSWLQLSDYGFLDVIIFEDKLYNVHPTIPAHEAIAVPLKVPVGTLVAGVRWTELATDEQIKRFQLN